MTDRTGSQGGGGYMGDRSSYDHSMSDRHSRGRSSVVPMSDGSNEAAANITGSRTSSGGGGLLTSGSELSANAAAYQVGQYVHSRARSSKRKKDKNRKKKLSLSPTRAPTKRFNTMEESSLRTWRDYHDFDDPKQPTSTKSSSPTTRTVSETATGSRPPILRTPPRSKSNDDSALTLMREDSNKQFAAYAASKYVLRKEEDENDQKKRSPSPTSYVPSGMDPADDNDSPKKGHSKLGGGFQDVEEDVEAIQRNFYTLGETQLEKSLKNQRRQQICWTILFLKLLVMGGVGLIVTVFLHASRHANVSPGPGTTLSPTTQSSLATLAPTNVINAATHRPPIAQTSPPSITSAPKNTGPSTSTLVAQTGETTVDEPKVNTPSAASATNSNAGSSTSTTSAPKKTTTETSTSATSAPAAHHHLPFPPADEAALDLFCDNDKLEKDGYAECERLCTVASCCWSDNPSIAACQDDSEIVRNQCTKYKRHCSILNQSY